jgi:hypothetical protein
MSIPENHVEMCKFGSKSDLGYKRVSDRIGEFASEAVKAVQEGTNTRLHTDFPQTAMHGQFLIEQMDAGESTPPASRRWYQTAPEIEEPEEH